MAHTFDNRNFISGKQQTFYSAVSPSSSSSSSSSRPAIRNTLKEISSSRQSSPRSNDRLLSYEENRINKPLDNQQNSKLSFHSPSTLNNSTYHERQQPLKDNYSTFSSENHSSDTKPPPPNRTPRITSTVHNNDTHHTNVLSQYSPNAMKTNTTYLNTTQVYITQPSLRDNSSIPSPPPPPPPRCPLQPPAIPPRNSPTYNQKNSIIIPDFNSSKSAKTIYRSPMISSTVKRNDLNDDHLLEHQFKPFSIDNNHPIEETTNGSAIGEYFGECYKCGETITSLDDPCDIFGQIYHSSCAICALCGRSVRNRHFFVQDQLYCEEDFLYTGFYETLEHCVACGHLITDTIAQALGQSYHLTCFKCSKCSICLDGIPFVKDEKRNLFCLHDYYITYGPRCDKCSNPIYPEDVRQNWI
ncbi:unnamed protein product [Rotaria sp. Silwood1]|nr:unnamed protein product [Rotaria sp. Silwood1]CAF1630515.1 unnamed protein product [Rotaria sp. Silwood1]CAF3804251.1 unnamed protein product [Rotaria sp. Silwood1]CAF4759479.1 unnamed protein product [Rotaria sp. Silwood1]